MNGSFRRDARVAEGDGLLNRCTGSNPYRGFESLSLRFHPPSNSLLRNCSAQHVPSANFLQDLRIKRGKMSRPMHGYQRKNM